MYKYLFLFIFTFFASLLSADHVLTSVSRNQVGMNESFVVQYKLAHESNERPDFSPLEKDFEILSTSSGFAAQFINGRVTQEMNWNLTLMPKREGDVLLPAIKFGQASSEPQNIQVSAAQAPKKEDDLYIATEIKSGASVYEQMPLIYKVSLYTSLQGIQGNLSELKTNDPSAIIEHFGNDTQYETFDQTGKKRLVVERQYSVIPGKAGELVFYPIIFEGAVQAVNRSFYNAQPVFKKIYSNQEKIEVKPIPAGFQKKSWFAANDVRLKEEWSKDPASLNIGEPVTWTITVTAEGNFASQIPDINLKFDKALKQYPDKPEESTQMTSGGFTGTKQVKIALIPSKIGDFTLPEVKIEWWNLQKDKLEVATLPSRKIQVMDEMAEEEKQEEIALANPITEEKINVVAEKLIEKKVENGVNLYWALLAIIPVFAVYYYMQQKPKDSLKSYKKQLKEACRSNQPKAAENALLLAMNEMLPHIKPLNLITIKNELPENLRCAIDDLYKCLYGQGVNWDGKAFWKAFSSFKPAKSRRATKKHPHLQELYPS